jgi:hypothetical protein
MVYKITASPPKGGCGGNLHPPRQPLISSISPSIGCLVGTTSPVSKRIGLRLVAALRIGCGLVSDSTSLIRGRAPANLSFNQHFWRCCQLNQ